MAQVLKLYLLTQAENFGPGTYDSAVVAAYTEEEARMYNPDVRAWGNRLTAWCSSPEKVRLTYIGVATSGVEPGVLISSFNAG